MIGRAVLAVALYTFARVRLRRFVRIRRGPFFACTMSPYRHRLTETLRVPTSEGTILLCQQHGLVYESFEPGLWE